jgi:hypothetical protein
MAKYARAYPGARKAFRQESCSRNREIQLRLRAVFRRRDFEEKRVGAGEGNRTLVFSLEGCCSTIELHPRLNHRAGGGGSRTRTYEGIASGFTVRPLCRSGHSPLSQPEALERQGRHRRAVLTGRRSVGALMVTRIAGVNSKEQGNRRQLFRPEASRETDLSGRETDGPGCGLPLTPKV